MKKYLFGLLAIVMVAGASAFTVKKHKPSSQTLYYIAETLRQRVEFNAYTNYTNESLADPPVPIMEKSWKNDQNFANAGAHSAFENVSNWSTAAGAAYTGGTSPAAYNGSDGNSYVWQVSTNLYDAGDADDGYADGSLSKQDLLVEVEKYYVANGTLPVNFTLTGTNPFSVTITAIASESAHD